VPADEGIQLQGDEQVTNFRILTLSSLIMAATLAACSSGDYHMGPHANVTGTAPPYAPANTDYMPNYLASTSIGQVMTTPEGSTVYAFDRDQAGRSNCYGDCARHWPPVLATSGAQPCKRMSLVTRQDGQQQWAYDGRPLYTYGEDAMHGDVKGENAGNVWHVVK
jgi:predicted lipoprotein with Yx(FWY)xxD motif